MNPLWSSLVLAALASSSAASSTPSRLEQLVEANILGTHAFQVALGEEGGQGRCGLLLARSAHRRAARRARDAPGRPAEGRREGGARLGRGEVLGLRPEGRPRARSSPSSLTLAGHAPRQRLRALAAKTGRRRRACKCGRSRVSSRRTSRWSATATASRSCSPSTRASACPSTSASSACRERTRPSSRWAVSSRGGPAPSPVGTNAAEWQIAARKNWNWGEKNLGIRDDKVLAGELLEEPDVKALVPRIKALPAQRIAVIGHSFTMQLHWSTPGAFVPVVTAIFARENPKVEFRQFQGGGLTSTRAVNRFYAEVVAWKPQQVLLVVINRTDEDLRELRAPRARPRRGGSEGPHVRRRARPQGHGERAAGPGARGRAGDGHDGDRREPAAGRGP